MYQFTIKINGSGDSVEEAWRDAIEYFALDPGSCPEETEYCIIEDEDMIPALKADIEKCWYCGQPIGNLRISAQHCSWSGIFCSNSCVEAYGLSHK